MLLCFMYINAYLSTFKLIWHLFAHWTNLLVWSCNSVMYSGFLALWQNLVSSTYLVIQLSWYLDHLYIYKNINRPNILPCGTSDVTSAPLLCVLLMQTRWQAQQTSYESIHVHCLLSLVLVISLSLTTDHVKILFGRPDRPDLCIMSLGWVGSYHITYHFLLSYHYRVRWIISYDISMCHITWVSWVISYDISHLCVRYHLIDICVNHKGTEIE